MFRTARTLVFYPDTTHGLVAYNYLQNKRFGCSVDTLRFMITLRDWREADDIADSLGVPADESLSRQLAGLESAGCLIARGSDNDNSETRHEDNWQWGVPTALYHASLYDRPVVSVDEALDHQRVRLRNDDSLPPSIFDDLKMFDTAYVPLPSAPLNGTLQEAIDKRRTRREAGTEPVTLTDIAACLNNALGVQEIGRNEAGAPIVFKPTPSGGARAPFDAFVLVRQVEGLSEGIYAYEPQERALYQTSPSAPSFSKLLNDQDWPDNMDALIVLQANFERTMWKYHDANAYRVVLIEAGHIGQNIMLAATARGLSACPSAAIDLKLAEQELYNCDPIMSPALYALGLVRPATRH